MLTAKIANFNTPRKFVQLQQMILINSFGLLWQRNTRSSRRPDSLVVYALAYWSCGLGFGHRVRRGSMHTASHHHPPIVLICLKYCWKGLKIAYHPSIHPFIHHICSLFRAVLAFWPSNSGFDCPGGGNLLIPLHTAFHFHLLIVLIWLKSYEKKLLNHHFLRQTKIIEQPEHPCDLHTGITRSDCSNRMRHSD